MEKGTPKAVLRAVSRRSEGRRQTKARRTLARKKKALLRSSGQDYGKLFKASPTRTMRVAHPDRYGAYKYRRVAKKKEYSIRYLRMEG